MKIRHEVETTWEVRCDVCDLTYPNHARESDADTFAFRHIHPCTVREIASWFWGPQ